MHKRTNEIYFRYVYIHINISYIQSNKIYIHISYIQSNKKYPFHFPEQKSI